MTINPPPTWTTGSEIPKKERMCVPMKYDPTSRKKLFIAIRQDSALRMVGELFPRHSQEDGASSQRVNDWKQRTENQEEAFCRFNHDISSSHAREVERARRLPIMFIRISCMYPVILKVHLKADLLPQIFRSCSNLSEHSREFFCWARI